MKMSVKEKEVLFYLEQQSKGVAVKAHLSERGWPWFIIQFNDDGTVTRFPAVGHELGLPLDDLGRIKVS